MTGYHFVEMACERGRRNITNVITAGWRAFDFRRTLNRLLADRRSDAFLKMSHDGKSPAIFLGEELSALAAKLPNTDLGKR